MELRASISKNQKYLSFGLQGLLSAAFLMASFQNIARTDMAVKGAIDMGYAEGSIFYLGIVFLLSTILYIWPKTTFIGAILLTAWLGGAVATHVIHSDTLGFIFLPAVFGVLVWVALGLRYRSFGI